MAEHSSGFCKTCNAQRAIIRSTPSHVLHFLITIFTCGFWIIPWGLMTIFPDAFRCTVCGTKAKGGGFGLLLGVLLMILAIGAAGMAFSFSKVAAIKAAQDQQQGR